MSTNQKPVFISGATGSVGSRFAGRLSETGQAVRVLVRNPERAAALQRMANVTVIPGDLTRPESLRGCMEGCSLVYHCAAKLGGMNMAASQVINVDGTQALLDETVRSGVERFIHLSTIAVYGFSCEQNITEEFPWPESSEPYITTKQQAERLVQKAAEKIPVSIARLGDVIGPGQFTWTINFIQKINQGVLTPPREADSGFVNPVYIDNLIDALLLLGAHPAAAGQIFNVVDGTPIRTSDYIRRMAGMAGKTPFALPGAVMKGIATLLMVLDTLRGREATATPGDVEYLLKKSTFSAQKIREMLGWKPAVDLEEGFRRTEEWLRGAGYLAA